jgi:DnaJ family protein C protein 2
VTPAQNLCYNTRNSNSHPTTPSSVSAPSTKFSVYPAGPSFIASARRQHLNLSWEDDDKLEADLLHQKLQAKAIEAGEELYPGLGEEQEEKHVLAYDPKEWKVGRGFRVSGLSPARYSRFTPLSFLFRCAFLPSVRNKTTTPSSV